MGKQLEFAKILSIRLEENNIKHVYLIKNICDELGIKYRFNNTIVGVKEK